MANVTCEWCNRSRSAHCTKHVAPCCPGKCPRPAGELHASWHPRGQVPADPDAQRRAVLGRMRLMTPGSRGALAADVAAWIGGTLADGQALLMRLRSAGLVQAKQTGQLTRWTLTDDALRIIAGREPIAARSSTRRRG
jgi:hypothetical protein